MKRNLLLLVFIVSCYNIVYAQAPQEFAYQGALRNPDGTAVANKAIRLKLSVLDGSATGTAQYTEERQATTNTFGLYTVSIGSTGASATTGNITTVNWTNGLKYLKVEIDVDGGTNYTTAGASQLLSVPYALFAGATTGTATGDLTGTFPSPVVAKIQGVPVSSIAPTANQYLQFDGTEWKPVAIPSVTGADVTTSHPAILEITNGTGAALKAIDINIKPGLAGNLLVTAADNTVKWQSVSDTKLVTGTLSSITLDKLADNTTQVQPNTTSLAIITVTGALPGSPVFVTTVGDVLDFSVAASWVSAANEVTIRFANYQPQPVTVTGKTYKIFLIQ